MQALHPEDFSVMNFLNGLESETADVEMAAPGEWEEADLEILARIAPK